MGASHCLFGLAPAGVYPAAIVANRAVGSYPTISPLPATSLLITSAVCFLWHFPSRDDACAPLAPRRYLAACPMEPGLSSAERAVHVRRDRPAAHLLEPSFDCTSKIIGPGQPFHVEPSDRSLQAALPLGAENPRLPNDDGGVTVSC